MRTLIIYKLGNEDKGHIPSKEDADAFGEKLLKLTEEEREKLAKENNVEVLKVDMPEGDDKDYLVIFKLGSEKYGWVPDQTHVDTFKTLLDAWKKDPNSFIIYHWGINIEVIKVPKNTTFLVTRGTLQCAVPELTSEATS
jgi:hypothetical protein